AVTIEIDSQSSVEGWARPGTKVDVTLTYMSNQELTSKVIVQNARVLSYGGDATLVTDHFGSLNRKSVKPGSTITLEVSPGDALKIQTSKQLGSLSLLMRAPEDDKAAAVTEVDRNLIDGAKAKIEPQVKTCKRGKMRLEGKEYIIDCDGSIAQLDGFE
ncbi:MAG: Flp pilus assembly protein CpaB, partial [Bdellovibrionales bacterium]|nr:Flp pilus assembly protein CpaB [Bdellovibrionales bacterium]